MPVRSKKFEEDVLNDIFRREGRTFTDDPVDRGGATKFGVTLGAYRRWLGDHTATASMLSGIDEDIARQIFIQDYFHGHGFSQIEDDVLYTMVLDSSVLFGPPRAGLLLQKSVGAELDGVVGPKTAGKANQFNRVAARVNFIQQRVLYHIRRVKQAPDQIRFVLGWAKRAFDFPVESF